MAVLRGLLRGLLAGALDDLRQPYTEEHVRVLEAACAEEAALLPPGEDVDVGIAKVPGTLLEVYALVARALRIRRGELLEQGPGCEFLDGPPSAERARLLVRAAPDVPPADEPSPRQVMRAAFWRALRAAGITDAGAATEVERSCYNETIRIATRDSIGRSWDCEAFLACYSHRCGLVLNNIRPDSTPCILYGPHVAALVAGKLVSPGQLGRMQAAELLPAASERERAEIERRRGQEVQEKVSNLYRCPFCGVNRCVYKTVQTRALDEAPTIQCVCKNCERSFVASG